MLMIAREGCLGRDFNDGENGDEMDNLSSRDKGFLMKENLDWWFGGDQLGFVGLWQRAVDGELQWPWENSIVVRGGEVAMEVVKEGIRAMGAGDKMGVRFWEE
ncbi:hypothetical protein V6N13_089554 [Hibiscus sabdariffa]